MTHNSVSRTDSVRSDASSRPKVSFNRDVHVKRISSRGGVSGLSSGRPVTLRRDHSFSEDPHLILRAAKMAESNGIQAYTTLPRRPKTEPPVPPSGKREVSNVRMVPDGSGSLDRRKRPPRLRPLQNGGTKQELSPILESPPIIGKSQQPQPKTKRTFTQRMKHLFRRKSPSKTDPQPMDEVQNRFTEYRGRSPEPTETDTDGGRYGDTHVSSSRRGSDGSKASWFKSIDRLKPAKRTKVGRKPSNAEDKFRFFGDTDTESTRPRNLGTETDDSDDSRRKSIVYLHSAAVGDIPSHQLPVTYKRTLTRSVSVLGPWGPRSTLRKNVISYSNANLPAAAGVRRTPSPTPPPRSGNKKLLFTGPSFDETYPLFAEKGRK